MEEKIREAFNKVKDDINFLNNEILTIKILLDNIKNVLVHLQSNQKNIIHQLTKINEKNTTYNRQTTDIPTHNPTLPQEIGGLKNQNLDTSTGNRGVPTDRQTDKLTDRQTDNIEQKRQKNISENLDEASEILNSLDSIKKEIRIKFKNLTNQEMVVFSTIYQLEEQNYNPITYKLISKHLKLTESSIRDYTQRIVSKGVPLVKNKINNKQIHLSISKNLKNLASLSTIIKLREL